jgi:hypothetical protein
MWTGSWWVFLQGKTIEVSSMQDGRTRNTTQLLERDEQLMVDVQTFEICALAH